MSDLEKRIQMREEVLASPDLYSNVRVLSRHALEVEQSLQKGTEKANSLSHLVQPRKQGMHLYCYSTLKKSATEFCIKSEMCQKFFSLPLALMQFSRLSPLSLSASNFGFSISIVKTISHSL